MACNCQICFVVDLRTCACIFTCHTAILLCWPSTEVPYKPDHAHSYLLDEIKIKKVIVWNNRGNINSACGILHTMIIVCKLVLYYVTTTTSYMQVQLLLVCTFCSYHTNMWLQLPIVYGSLDSNYKPCPHSPGWLEEPVASSIVLIL